MLSSFRNAWSIHHWFAYGRLFLPFCCRGLISIKGPQLKPSQTYIYKCEQGQPSAFWVPVLALESRLANFLCQGFALCQTPCWDDLSGFPPDRLTGSQRQEPSKNCSCWIERPWDQESATLDAPCLWHFASDRWQNTKFVRLKCCKVSFKKWIVLKDSSCK